MADADGMRDRLYGMLLDMFVPPLPPGEMADAVRELWAGVAPEDAEQSPEEILDGLPEIPRSFFEKWAGKFADEEVAQAGVALMRERLEKMLDGSGGGRMLALIAFYEFAADHVREIDEDLAGLAKDSGKSVLDLKIALEAVSTYRLGQQMPAA